MAEISEENDLNIKRLGKTPRKMDGALEHFFLKKDTLCNGAHMVKFKRVSSCQKQSKNKNKYPA